MSVLPRRIHESGNFALPLPPEQAFPLFTAEGERLWVPGWDPQMLGETPQQKGLVFLTGEGEEHTIWTVLESDPELGRLRYSRVTPRSRAGIVTVTIAGDAGGSQIQVQYNLTALSFDGSKRLDDYSGDKFRLMLAEWRRLILEYLEWSGA